MISKEDRDKILAEFQESVYGKGLANAPEWITVWLAYGELERILNTLTAEDDNQIAKRLIEEYCKDQFVGGDPVSIPVDHIKDWLDRREE